MIAFAYCNCKNPEPEEVKHGYVVCMKCNLNILQSEDAPEPDFYSEDPNQEEELERKAGL